MTKVPDPFQPWRPQEQSSDPYEAMLQPWHPPDHELQPRPTSPPPVVMPTPLSAQSVAPKLSLVSQIFLLLTLAWGLVLVLTLIHLGGHHLPRVLPAFIALWLGLFFFLLHRSAKIAMRIGVILFALFLAGGCWILLPTFGGLNWLEAHRRLQQLHHLSTEDRDGFLAGQFARMELMREFSTWERETLAAERDWLQRHLETQLEQANTLKPSEPLKALNLLSQAHDLLERASPSLTDDLLAKLSSARRDALDSLLQSEKRRIHRLVQQGKYGQAQTEAVRLTLEQLPEARALDMEQNLESAVREMRQDALRGHLQVVCESLRRLLQAQDYKGVAEEGQRYDRLLRVLAAPLGMEAEVREKLAGPRRQALEARLEQARQQAHELLKEERYQALGKLGEHTFEDLEEEASAIGVRDALLRFRDSCRVFADLAHKANKKDAP